MNTSTNTPAVPSVPATIPTDRLLPCTGKTITGVYCLTQRNERESPRGGTCLHLLLEDAYGEVRAFVWPEHQPRVAPVSIPSFVRVTAEIRTFEGKPQLSIRSLSPAAPDQIGCAAALLPRSRCPEGTLGALSAMVDLEQRLTTPLAGLLKRVLLDPQIGIPMLRCRASVRHHHSEPGGLIVHCTEPLDQIKATLQMALPGQVDSAELAQVAYLLHDIGKLRSVGEYRRGQFGLVVRHETLSLILLAPHLAWLESESPELAAALTYIFEYLAMPSGHRPMAQLLAAEIVVMFDQISVAPFNGRDVASLLRGSCRPAHIGTIDTDTEAANDPISLQEVRHAG